MYFDFLESAIENLCSKFYVSMKLTEQSFKLTFKDNWIEFYF